MNKSAVGIIIAIVVLVVGVGLYFNYSGNPTPDGQPLPDAEALPENAYTGSEVSTDNAPLGGGIRAGLDFQIEITEGGETQTLNLDIGNYAFKDGETIFQTQRVDSGSGTIDLLFKKISDYQSTGDGGPIVGPEIDYDTIFDSDEDEFSIDYYQVFRAEKGQSVSLNSTDIIIRLLDVTGRGCPPGAQC